MYQPFWKHSYQSKNWSDPFQSTTACLYQVWHVVESRCNGIWGAMGRAWQGEDHCKGQLLSNLLYHFNFLKLSRLIQGKAEGNWRWEWQRMEWLDSITDAMDMNLSKLWEIVENGGAWCAAVHGVTKSWTQLSNWTKVLSCFLRETQMYRAVFWTLWERVRVGWFGRMVLKHVYYHMWNKSPVQVQCMILDLVAGALGWPRGMVWGGMREEDSGSGTWAHPW